MRTPWTVQKGLGKPLGIQRMGPGCQELVSDCGCCLVPKACHTPLSMGFPRQEYWRGLPFPSPGDLPYLGIESAFPTLQQILYCWAMKEKCVCRGRGCWLEIQLHPPDLQGREQAGGWDQSPMDNDLISHACLMKLPKIPRGQALGSFQVPL